MHVHFEGLPPLRATMALLPIWQPAQINRSLPAVRAGVGHPGTSPETRDSFQVAPVGYREFRSRQSG